MTYAVKLAIAVWGIFALATVVLFMFPANANPACVSVKKDVANLELVLAERGEVGKVWLWTDKGYAITIAASPVFKKGSVILSFYNANGCLMPHPGTGRVRTAVPVTDKIKAYIAKSKLFWSNTDKVLLTSAGLPV